MPLPPVPATRSGNGFPGLRRRREKTLSFHAQAGESAAALPGGATAWKVEVDMQEKENRHYCYQCRHFRNEPEYLEHVFKGLTSLGSAHGSVRVEDGICQRNDLYLAATRCCSGFEPILPVD